MNRFVRLALAAAWSFGCSSPTTPEVEDRDGLVGGWGVQLSEAVCLIEYVFEGDFTYVAAEICRPQSGADKVLVQLEHGQFSLDRPWMTLDPDQSTCSGTTTHTVRYSVSGDTLFIVAGSHSFVFERLPDSTGEDPERVGQEADLGCFDDSGYLHPSPIVRVP